MSGKIFILNGPNLNLLGTREPDIYGALTLDDLRQACERKAEALGFEAVFRQTNSEGELVGWIQESGTDGDALVLNAGAYTHTSVAILDALKATGVPVIEVHLSNVFAREQFRHNSYVSPAATGVICGLGGAGYELAIDAVAGILKKGE